MALADVISRLRGDPGFMQNVVAWRTLPAQEPHYAPIPHTLHPSLARGLERRGIGQLYSHQAQSIEVVHAGQGLVVVTPTASGKSLCYQLPVLHGFLHDPAARALFLYPTKALAQDQLAALREWSADVDAHLPHPLYAAVYDGDTPTGERPRIRTTAQIVLSNPDMLHAGILPNHTQWADFLRGLRYVVIDELHTYRGVFGSHVANVLRRLQRVCAFYGARPQFICTSATIANPQQLAELLLEQPVTLLARSGAPRGEKQVILYNPPLYDVAHGLRASAVLEAQNIAARCVMGDVQTIVFGRSRLTTELLLGYLRESVGGGAAAGQSVRGYRGGYLPTERRAIEAGLRNGSVRAVAATNALELGIDIGQLQAAVLCGYPGSIASLWQQIGRAGRTRDSSLAVLVATGLPIDQYIVRHPEFIFDRSPENALLNADNLMLLVDQMRCAVAELPFGAGEPFGKSHYAGDVLALLQEQGEVQGHAGRFLWNGVGSPTRSIGLRSAGNDPVLIQVDERSVPGAAPIIIGSVDRSSARSLVHDGAVYLHEGASYIVELLDMDRSMAHVRPAGVDYYTAVDSESTVEVLHEQERRFTPGAVIGHGEVRVSLQVQGYRRIKRFMHENMGVFPLNYPPQFLETTGYWFNVTPEAQQRLAAAGEWFDSVNDYGPNWQQQREAVRARDRFRCVQCGAQEAPGRQHDVHHLTPFRTFGYVAGINENYRNANRLENLILVCRTCHRRIESAVRTRGALDGLGYALANLAPLYLMCDRNDLGLHVARADNARARQPGAAGSAASGDAGITLYELIAAGLGFSVRLFELHDTLLAAARENIAACPCSTGCPACMGPVLESGEQLETKRLTLALIDELARTGKEEQRER